MTRPPRILVVGAVTLNGGDAAILEAQFALFHLAWPAGFYATVADSDPEAAATYLPDVRFVSSLYSALIGETSTRNILKIRRKLLPAWLRFCCRIAGPSRRRWAFRLLSRRARGALMPVLNADLVAYTGGTSLVDHYWLQPKVLDLSAAAALGIPTVLLPQSLGPFGKPASRRLMAPILRAADLVLLRDNRSLEHVRDLAGTEPSSHVVADTVFALVRADVASCFERVNPGPGAWP